MNSNRLLAARAAALLVIAATGLWGCTPKSNQANITPDNRPPLVPSTAPQADTTNDQASSKDHTVSVYTVSEDKDGARQLLPKQVPADAEAVRSPAAFALKTLIADPNSPLPKGTTLLSVKIDDTGVATADFSKEFKDNFPGGDQAEALAINSVLSTLGQFKTVKSVQFLVEGKKIDSLGGNESLDEPLPVPQAGVVVGQAQ